MLDFVIQAWNIRPKSTSKRWIPTAEFAESFLIFFYGGTNIFLEHLGNSGGEWSSEDLEHLSLTVLFLGGGLVSRPSPHLVLPRFRENRAFALPASLLPLLN